MRKRAFSRGSLLDTLHTLVCELQDFDEDVVSLRVQISGVVLDGPRVRHDESRDVESSAIEHDDGDVPPLDLAGGDLPMPLRQLERRRHTALESDVPELRQTRELAEVRGIGALPILDHVRRRRRDLDLAEAGDGDAVDLHSKLKVPQRILTGHRLCSSLCGAQSYRNSQVW